MSEDKDDKAASQHGRRFGGFQPECDSSGQGGFQEDSSKSRSQRFGFGGSDWSQRADFGSGSFGSGSRRTVSGGILQQLIDEVDDQLLEYDSEIDKLNSKKQRLISRRSSLLKLCEELSHKTGESLPPIDNSEEE
ncbi:MAG: hypothetical protein WAN66_14200 [Limnoraphis robusta]|uniref:Uncharacterized protein n=1 Tax=Limnoraphis robusta CS-951 TaxID=1637645 RepID=A0A0F5YH86_9CYAN|nr:hypothetical protein [Limnoraphis robusta]KKD38251.1 hypothetical protein WN50_09855 [Limnoraphis robusta CS-951]